MEQFLGGEIRSEAVLAMLGLGSIRHPSVGVVWATGWTHGIQEGVWAGEGK